MLQKTKSCKTNLLRHTLIIPIVLIMLFCTSCQGQVQSDKENTIDLEQFSFSRHIDETISGEAKQIHQNHDAFLWANADYVSWQKINHETGVISYSVHHKDEKVPEELSQEGKVGNKDGSSYKVYMNFNYFD